MCAIERSNPEAGVGQILKLYLEYFSSDVHFSKLKRTSAVMYTFQNLNAKFKHGCK